jgi:hypothetical protein
MPYCVNCGVKLNNNPKACPLCGTPVFLPTQSGQPSDCAGFPTRRDDPDREFDRDLWLKLVSVVTAAPALLMVFIDYLAGNGIDWSLYILFSLVLVWVWCASPFFFKRNRFTFWLVIDALALILFMFMVERTSHTGNWALPLATPITLAVSAIVFTLVNTFRRKLVRQLQKPALIFVMAALLCMIIELAVDLYRAGIYRPGWSILTAIPLIAFAAILLILQRRQWIVEELRHWFRI